MTTRMRIVVLVAAVLSLVLLPAGAASAATYNGTVTGTPNTWYHQLDFAPPGITATLTTDPSKTYPQGNIYPTNMQPPSADGPGQNMKQVAPPGNDPFWGGNGVYTNTYTPTDIKDTTGVTVVYQNITPGLGDAASCPGPPANPSQGATVPCDDADTLSWDFSQPVTNPVFHVMNIGSTSAEVSPRQSLWAELVLDTPGLTLASVSSAGNFTATSSSITAATPVTERNLAVDQTGSGSVMVVGTYTHVEFKVNLKWYGILPPATSRYIMEGLAFNWTLDVPAPTVSGVSPPSGPTTGGTPITVTGSGFLDGATVTVGGVGCSPVTFVSATELKCTTGAHAAGTTDVVVTNPDLQTATKVGAFTYTTACPLTVTGARAANKRLPVGRTVTLVKSMSTVPQCRLQISKSATYRSLAGRGDMVAPIKIWVSKGGKVQAYTRARGAKATVRAYAKAVKLPYVADSSTWKRTWKS